MLSMFRDINSWYSIRLLDRKGYIMTTEYNTYDSNKVTFDSGETVILTNNDIDELVQASDVVEDIQLVLDEANNTIQLYKDAFIEVKKVVDYYRDDIKRKKYKDIMIDILSSIDGEIEDIC